MTVKSHSLSFFFFFCSLSFQSFLFKKGVTFANSKERYFESKTRDHESKFQASLSLTSNKNMCVVQYLIIKPVVSLNIENGNKIEKRFYVQCIKCDKSTKNLLIIAFIQSAVYNLI